MPRISEILRHSLGQECAIERIKQLIPRLKATYSGTIDQVYENWQGNTNTFGFSVMGFNVSGTIEVTNTTVELIGDLPLAAHFFKDRIINVIHKEGAVLLA